MRPIATQKSSISLNLFVLIIFLFAFNFSIARNSCHHFYLKNNSELSEAQELYLEAYNLFNDKSKLLDPARNPSLIQGWYGKDMWNGILDLDKILEEATERDRKLKILSILGFKVKKKDKPMPTHEEVTKRFIRALDLMKIPHDLRILPSLVLFKKSEIDNQVDYKFVVPGVDPWPKESGFKIFKVDDGFNLPEEVVIREMKHGRFPLLMATHDLFHFVGFLLHPNYMMELRKVYKNLDLSSLSSEMRYRIVNINEVLTLADPSKKEEIYQLLSVPKLERGNEHIEFKKFAQYFESLSESEILDHARSLRKAYNQLLLDFGGASTSLIEKRIFELYYSSGLTFLNKFYKPIDYNKSYHNSRTWHDSMSFSALTLRNLINLSFANEKSFLGSLMVKDYFEDPFLQEYLLDESRQGKFDITYDELKFKPRDEVLKALRLQVTRMEFLMWESSHDISVEKIISNILLPYKEMDPKFIEFIKYGFGENSELYRSILPIKE